MDKPFSSGRVILLTVNFSARAKCPSFFNLGQSAIFSVLNTQLDCSAEEREEKDPLATTTYQNSEENSPWVMWKTAINTKLNNELLSKSATSFQHQVQGRWIVLPINS